MLLPCITQGNKAKQTPEDDSFAYCNPAPLYLSHVRPQNILGPFCRDDPLRTDQSEPCRYLIVSSSSIC